MGSAASTSVGDVGLVTLIVCHSHQERKIRNFLESVLSEEPAKALDVVVVTESFPRDLQTRAEMLGACQRAVVGVDPLFQTSAVLIDSLSFLKDTRKQVVAGPLTFFTRPSGAVGAICTAFGTWIPRLFENIEEFKAQSKLLLLSELVEVTARSRTPEEMSEVERQDQALFEEAHCLVENTERPHLFIVHSRDDGYRIAKEFDGIESQGTQLAGSSSLSSGDVGSDIKTLAASRVVAFVITSGCVDDPSYRRLFETALRWKKPVLPISAGIRLSGWLQMAMAGRVWYQVDLAHMDYMRLPYSRVPNCPCKLADSCLATDFLMCANGILTATAQPGVLEASLIASREQATLEMIRDKAVVGGLDPAEVEQLIALVTEQVHAIEHAEKPVTDLEALGVATTTEAIEDQRDQAALAFPPASELLPEKPELELHHQHYQVTRLAFEPPPPVLDANGLPIPNLQLDAMFSYQWGSQDIVLDVHQQGRVFNCRAWFDVFGHMQGNVNSAMAAAVENVACVIVFLTQKYLESVNCQLEFQYAARCRKPFILVLLADVATLALPCWITDVVGHDFSVYPTRVSSADDRVLALDYSADRVNGVPLTIVLFGAIRVLAAQRHRAPLAVAYDASLRLYATTSALRHALLARPKPDTAGHSETCSRCGAAFSPSVASSLPGCRRHAAYYMGGSLLAGRWVCCQETRADGPGCQPANHIHEPRVWTRDPSYNTHTWQPE